MARTFLNHIRLSPSASTPTSPASGTLWYDSANLTLKVYNGTTWDWAADADITALFSLALPGSTAFLKRSAAGVWSYDTATYLTGNQSITLSGDVTGTGTTAITATLANSGVTAGTYNNSGTTVTPITVDAKGRITATGAAVTIAPTFANIASKPTNIAGYGITDAVAVGANNAFTGANTFVNATGQTFRATSTTDGIIIDGNGLGTTSLASTLTVAALTGNRTVTLPDATVTFPTPVSNAIVLVSENGTQTLTNKTITATSLTTATITTPNTTSGNSTLWADVTTGTVTIANNLGVGGTLSVATGSTGASSINIGRTGASVALSGTVTATTPTADSNNTNVATTAYVTGQKSTTTPPAIASSGSVGTTLKYALSDHTHAGVTSVNGNQGAVTAAQIATAYDSARTWTTYTATLTNMAGVTQTCKYVQIGSIVFVQFNLVGSSTLFVSGAVTISLPVTAATSARNISPCNMVAGGSTFKGFVFVNGGSSTTTATIQVYNASTTYLTQSALSSTVPNSGGWQNLDSIWGSFFYEV